jgi:hypothetical protein
MWGNPETRKRVVLLAIRKGLYAKVGAPPTLLVPRSAIKHRTSEDTMLPPTQVRHFFEAH